MISLVHIRGNKLRAIGISASNQYSWSVAHISRQSCRSQGTNKLACWNKNFSAHMPAFFFRSQLIFEVYARSTSLNHSLHQLISVQRSTKASFSVRNDWRIIINLIISFNTFDLVGSLKCFINFFNNLWNTVRWIKTLIRIHVTSKVCVSRNLPATKINCFQSSFDLLYRLVSCKGS